jgi:hypothetical protein
LADDDIINDGSLNCCLMELSQKFETDIEYKVAAAGLCHMFLYTLSETIDGS